MKPLSETDIETELEEIAIEQDMRIVPYLVQLPFSVSEIPRFISDVQWMHEKDVALNVEEN